MMEKGLTEQEVEYVAKLANLPLNTSEIEIFQKQLSEVMEYVGKIEEIKRPSTVRYGAGKTENACLRRQAKRKETQMVSIREDVVGATKCLSQEDALSGTEDKHNGLFLVPAIFEE